jgi:hypothetical protein
MVHTWSKSGGLAQGVRSGTLYSDPLWRTHRPGLETGVKVHPPASVGLQSKHEMVNFWILAEISVKECAINRVTYSRGDVPTGMRERAELAPRAVRTTAGEGAALTALCSNRVNVKRNRVEMRKLPDREGVGVSRHNLELGSVGSADFEDHGIPPGWLCSGGKSPFK